MDEKNDGRVIDLECRQNGTHKSSFGHLQVSFIMNSTPTPVLYNSFKREITSHKAVLPRFNTFQPTTILFSK